MKTCGSISRVAAPLETICSSTSGQIDKRLVQAAALLRAMEQQKATLCGATVRQEASMPAINGTEAVASNPAPVIGDTVNYTIADLV